VKITHSHLMPLQQHLYNGLARPVDHSIFALEWTHLPAVEWQHAGGTAIVASLQPAWQARVA